MKYLEASPLYTGTVNGTPVQYAIRYTNRAQRVSLRISTDQGVVFIVPFVWRLLKLDFDQLLSSRGEWVLQKLKEVEDVRSGTPVFDFKHGSTFSCLGNPVKLFVEHDPSARHGTAILCGGELRLVISDSSQRAVKLLFTAWCLARAKEVIPRRVAELNAEGHFSYSRIGVRNQRSRWGSCSRRGTLSFNWRLILAPPNVMDYIIYHELAHLTEMNHSVRFWRIVEHHFPGFRQAEKWLKYNGKSLFW